MKTNIFQWAVLLAAATSFTLTSCDKDDDKDGNKAQYVDLGLPSGTLWATCNVGATNPEDAGDYFSWGETETKDMYTFDTYKWNATPNGAPQMSKYFPGDNLTELELEDDAAYVNMGSDWCMPTIEQCRELLNYTRTEWTELNGVYGRKITSNSNGNSIFIPAVGHRVENYQDYYKDDTQSGIYWTRSLSSDSPMNAFYFAFGKGEISTRSEAGTRFLGRTVRAVRR
ncbi:MAG: hypothetical protein J6W69_03605 [Bacteroidales bacterium]|nr:hypothetical protein [Bacteroidales bacterium]